MVGVTESTLLDHTPPPASPHCKKRTSTSTLLGIDADSRATILDHLLLNRTRKTADAERKKLGEIELDGEEQDIVFTYTPFFNAEVPALLGLMDSKNPGHRTISSIANVQILQVCRQLFHEGKNILYGKNRFVLQSYRHPSPAIPNFVGSSNLASIKMLRMELPLEMKLDLRTGLQNYLGILKKRLPGLCELKLTTTFHPCDHVWSEVLQESKLEEEHRAILYSAACITHHHENLKKAIWDAKPGLLFAVELYDEHLSYCRRKYRLWVRLLANDLVVKLREYKRKYAFPFTDR